MLARDLLKLSMKYSKIIFTIAITATITIAAPLSERPESLVPTPAENAEFSREKPNISAKENADWQKLRAERRIAREQILSDIRNSSTSDKRELRQRVAKNRDEKPRFDAEIPKNQPRERRPFYERPEARPVDNMHGMPGPYPGADGGRDHH